MNSSKKHLAVILTVAVASLLVIPSVIEILASRSTLAERRARVDALSDAETSRLEINFETYKRLKSENPAELKRLENIHNQMQTQPELVETAVQYREWLSSLDSWRQDVIREIPDPDERYQYVNRMLDRKFIRIEPKWRPLAEAFPDGIEVLSQDVEAMSHHLKEGISKIRRIEMSEELKKTENIPEKERAAERRKLMIEFEKTMKQFDQLLTETVELISDKTIAGRIKDSRYKAPIAAFLLLEHEKRKSPETEFDTVFASLSPERQDAIMQMTPEAARIELRRESHAKKRDPKDDFYYAFLSGGGWMRRSGSERGFPYGRGREGGRPNREGSRGPGGPGPGGTIGLGAGRRPGERGPGGERGDGSGPGGKTGRPQRPNFEGDGGR